MDSGLRRCLVNRFATGLAAATRRQDALAPAALPGQSLRDDRMHLRLRRCLVNRFAIDRT